MGKDNIKFEIKENILTSPIFKFDVNFKYNCKNKNYQKRIGTIFLKSLDCSYTCVKILC